MQKSSDEIRRKIYNHKMTVCNEKAGIRGKVSTMDTNIRRFAYKMSARGVFNK